MIMININKDRELINEFSKDKETYSTKIINELPADANEFIYKYIDGKLVRDKAIDINYKSQDTINNEQALTNSNQDEINIDFDYRITMLELGV